MVWRIAGSSSAITMRALAIARGDPGGGYVGHRAVDVHRGELGAREGTSLGPTARPHVHTASPATELASLCWTTCYALGRLGNTFGRGAAATLCRTLPSPRAAPVWVCRGAVRSVRDRSMYDGACPWAGPVAQAKGRTNATYSSSGATPSGSSDSSPSPSPLSSDTTRATAVTTSPSSSDTSRTPCAFRPVTRTCSTDERITMP